MKDFLFFGNPSDQGALVDMLLWRIAIRQAETSLLEARLRDCAVQHVAWMESEIRAQSGLFNLT